MAGTSLRYELQDAVRPALQLLAARLGDLSPMMREIGGQLEASTVLRFEREVGPDGRGWLPSRRAREQGGQTLTDTARLRQSITHRAGPDSAEVGTNVVYAAIHQFGGTIVPKSAPKLVFTLPDGTLVFVDKVTIPARPFIGVSSDDEIGIADTIDDWLADTGGPVS